MPVPVTKHSPSTQVTVSIRVPQQNIPLQWHGRQMFALLQIHAQQGGQES